MGVRNAMPLFPAGGSLNSIRRLKFSYSFLLSKSLPLPCGSYGNPGRFCFGVGFRGIADRQAQRVLGLWVHKEPADRTR